MPAMPSRGAARDSARGGRTHPYSPSLVRPQPRQAERGTNPVTAGSLRRPSAVPLPFYLLGRDQRPPTNAMAGATISITAMSLGPGRDSARLSVFAAVICFAVAHAPLAYAARAPAGECRAWLDARRADTSARDSAQHPAIVGVVRSAVFGTAVPGARVNVVELGAEVCSDSSGEYHLEGLAGGPLTVRVTRAGFDTLSLLLTMPAAGTLRVDVALSPKVVVLDSVHVSAPRPDPGVLSLRKGEDHGDAWIWQGDPQ